MGEKNAGRGKPQHPRSQNSALQPLDKLGASGLQTVARKVNKHIEDQGFTLSIAANPPISISCFLPFKPIKFCFSDQIKRVSGFRR